MTGTAIELAASTQMTTLARRRNDGLVSEAAADLVRAGTAKATTRAYRRQWREFADWCDASERTALPADAAALLEYVNYLAARGLAPATIEQAISVIRIMHRTAGHPGQPDSEVARKALRGYSRQWAEGGHRVRRAPPAAVEQLRAMVDASDPATTLGIRDRALLVLGFSLMARRSELAALNLADVTETSDGLVVYIRMSKTDQDARGTEVAIPFGSRPDTCPVRTVRAWRERLADAGITSGRMFRPVNRHGHIVGDAATGAITGKGVSLAIRAAARRAGLPNADAYSGHSLRAGGATAAAKRGVPTATIAEHGRWAVTSPVVNRYVRTVDRWRDNAMADVGL